MEGEELIPLNASNVLLGSAIALRTSDGDGAAALPQRIKIFNWGENRGRTTGKRIVVGDKTLAVLSANQENQARDTVALDYEHQSFPGHKNYQKPPHHFAAHGKLEVIEGEGVFYNILSYTPNGDEFAANYPDVSPVAYTDEDDNLLFIHSVALTQAGDVEGLDFAAALSAVAPSTNDSNKPKTTTTMDDDKKDKYRDMLIELLGLKPAEGEDDVSDEAIAAAIAAKGEKKPEATPLSATGKETDKPEDANVVALNARLDKMEKDRLVDKATALGKVIPLSAEDIDKTDVAVLSAMIDKLPEGQVHTESKTQKEKPGEKVAALSADEKALCERLGISEEDFAKQNA